MFLQFYSELCLLLLAMVRILFKFIATVIFCATLFSAICSRMNPEGTTPRKKGSFNIVVNIGPGIRKCLFGIGKNKRRLWKHKEVTISEKDQSGSKDHYVWIIFGVFMSIK